MLFYSLYVLDFAYFWYYNYLNLGVSKGHSDLLRSDCSIEYRMLL